VYQRIRSMMSATTEKYAFLVKFSATEQNPLADMAVKAPIKKKLHGRAFYESLGSPRFVLAPMVDQSEFVLHPYISCENHANHISYKRHGGYLLAPSWRARIRNLYSHTRPCYTPACSMRRLNFEITTSSHFGVV
jgi:hypothetical protein